MTGTETTITTKDRILAAGLRLFSEKGYLGATTREIAKEAGIAEVTLFRHFPSKESILEEIIKRHSFLPALRDLLPEIRHLQFEDAIRSIARSFLETLQARKDMIKIMQSEVHRYPDQVRQIHTTYIAQLYETLASYFSDMQRAGVARDLDAELAGRALLGMIFSYFNTQVLLYDRRLDPEETDQAIGQFVDIFLRGTLK